MSKKVGKVKNAKIVKTEEKNIFQVIDETLSKAIKYSCTEINEEITDDGYSGMGSSIQELNILLDSALKLKALTYVPPVMNSGAK